MNLYESIVKESDNIWYKIRLDKCIEDGIYEVAVGTGSDYQVYPAFKTRAERGEAIRYYKSLGYDAYAGGNLDKAYLCPFEAIVSIPEDKIPANAHIITREERISKNGGF